MSCRRYDLRKRNCSRSDKNIIRKPKKSKLKKTLPPKSKYMRRACQEVIRNKKRLSMCIPTILKIPSPRFVAVEKLECGLDRRKSSSSTVAHISNYLTPEILVSVFGCLPLEDRKNVRLVCKLWNRSCARVAITQREKFVFRAHCSISHIINVLLKSRLIGINLEFHNIHINQIPTEVWKKAGHKVYGINIYPTSRLQDETLKDIILYCENLTSMKMWKSWERDTSSDLLDYLTLKNIKRNRLHTFATFYNPPHNSISPDIMKKIFLVFPCIKHFCVKNYVDTEMNSSRESIPLQSPMQLQSLTYGTLSNDCWQKKPIIPVWQTRLTKIDIMLTDHIDATQIFHFFVVQKELKIIILKMKLLADREFPKKVMFHILENCSNLREFRFIYPRNMKLNSEESARFFALISDLRCLSTSCDIQMESTSTITPKNLALNVLSLPWDEIRSLSYMLKHSVHLKHLQLDSIISNTILQEIFKNMTSLQTLILTCVDKCTNDGFRGQYPMRRLQKLEHLEIRYASLTNETFDTLGIAYEFQFLPLKHLRLCIDLSPADLPFITSNTPLLETLRFDYPYSRRLKELNLEKTVEFCKCLEKLKYLHVRLHFKGRNLRHKTYLKPLFEACPSLRYLRVDRDLPSLSFLPKRVQCRKVYSFDPFTREVLLNRSKHSFHYPGSRRNNILRNT